MVWGSEDPLKSAVVTGPHGPRGMFMFIPITHLMTS